ncbi:MAG: CCA tRNA nucleotidyltransferase [Oscillospiraceae bacterium]|nr:CCA tRNA nucleotidyltransferase [Oscillospiraceae bacterium]
MKITAPPAYIAFILNRLVSEGYESYVVGGSVRDAVMNRPVKDWDLATSAKPVEVASIFSETVLTGEKFGTVTVVLPECSVEVTTFRSEGEYNDGRHPDEVEFISSLNEDLSRRDFTINAMAESIEGELFDPFDGIEDIKNGIIRCVGGPNTRFSEDALRMFRALRFSAELGFCIETETLQAIYANTNLVYKISSERIRTELEKVLMSKRPEVAGEMIKIGLLSRFITTTGKSPAGLEKLCNLPQEPMLRWCAFCAILLKQNFISTATELLQGMHLDGKTLKTCLRALVIAKFPKNSTGIKILLSKNDAAVVRCAAAVSDVFSDTGEISSLTNAEEIISSGECYSLGELGVTGRDLLEIGHPPGRMLGETLSKLLEHVIKNPQDNKRDTLLSLMKASVDD